MTEYSPWHIVSTAHSCTDEYGGGSGDAVAIRKPKNFGGDSRVSMGSMAAITDGARAGLSRSEVSESEEEQSRTACIAAGEWYSAVSESLSSSFSLSLTSSGMGGRGTSSYIGLVMVNHGDSMGAMAEIS